MKYRLWKDVTGQWRWHLFAANEKIIAESGESYHNEKDCRDAIDLVKSSSNAPVEREPPDRGIGLGS
jgi:uncharacterized protein YegP (UPF0339 family)